MWNEGFRIVMEDTGFEPQSEPTDEQRRFFSDTAYADDELQLRRTIIARICTFDTSVEDPTDEQLQEAVEFLETVQEVGAPQNEWEQRAVQRLHDVLAKSVEAGRRQAERAPEPPVDEGTVEGAVGAGETKEEASTTQAPTTQAPTTQAPTTQAPTTQAPTTQAPTTQAPTGSSMGYTLSFDSMGSMGLSTTLGTAGDTDENGHPGVLRGGIDSSRRMGSDPNGPGVLRGGIDSSRRMGSDPNGPGVLRGGIDSSRRMGSWG